MLDTAKLKEYVDLDTNRKLLENKVAQMKNRLAMLEPLLIDMMAAAGVPSLKIGSKTVYIHTARYAKIKDGDRDKAKEAIRSADLIEYLKENFNSNSLSSFLREHYNNGTPFPKEFDGIISLEETYKLRTR